MSQISNAIYFRSLSEIKIWMHILDAFAKSVNPALGAIRLLTWSVLSTLPNTQEASIHHSPFQKARKGATCNESCSSGIFQTFQPFRRVAISFFLLWKLKGIKSYISVYNKELCNLCSQSTKFEVKFNAI